MKQETQDKLKIEFLPILGHASLSIGDGWETLLRELCQQLTLITKLTGIQVVASQVKEKYAGLRFYSEYDLSYCTKLTQPDINTAYTLIDAAINTAESKSEATCEMCGRAGHQHEIQGWLRTLCKEHAETIQGITDGHKLHEAQVPLPNDVDDLPII